ncbi:class IV adenylate cyclase [Sediminispirochaeta smaragdinae]|uniref:Adenylyl cyclase CyaB n=1 Tax=Sediminispirochaeta smaragdinae (strain DSM 11293 / JCM 15392 / SEBR 4228) TaxID=573413 RepID=E1R1S9_SEDSS|nr:class IV adenylate cyclase [Sediminispirochaeta smaragdinae]ADK81455.1 adenylyl cyclase CyaB [Sediminispirochaeta smaragdinae DSM 11293]
MSFEVEAKAWVRSEEERHRIEDFLRREARFDAAFHKLDYYYAPSKGMRDSDQLIRIRYLDPKSLENSPAVVTRKEKSFRGKVEINREVEFNVDPASSFEDMLFFFGYSHYITKEKKGYSYYLDSAHIELCEVSGLGYFIEIEVVLPETTDSLPPQKAADNIRSLFDRLGIAETEFEKRYYIELLLEGR